MADLTAADVTVTILKRGMIPQFGRITRVSMALGDGAKTYPSGGIPLPDASKFGMARGTIYQLPVPAQAGLVMEYDKDNHKLKLWRSVGHTHDLKYIGGIAETEAVMIAGGDTLGKNAATDRTVAGADSATKGGVVAAAAVALTAFTGAVPAISFETVVMGD